MNTNAYGARATGNDSFGYVGGGYTPGATTPGNTLSTVQRINYLNDIVIALVKGPLSDNRHSAAATGNINFGYWTGGSSHQSQVDRVDYSNDVATSLERGPLD